MNIAMPSIFCIRLPLPSLQIYASVSFLMFSAAIFFASDMTSFPNLKNNATGDVNSYDVDSKSSMFLYDSKNLEITIDTKKEVKLFNNVSKNENAVDYESLKEPLESFVGNINTNNIKDEKPLISTGKDTDVNHEYQSKPLKNPDEEMDETHFKNKNQDNIMKNTGSQKKSFMRTKLLLHDLLKQNTISERFYKICLFVVEDTVCLLVLINMVYCSAIVIGKCMQKGIFGELRVIEQNHMNAKFYSFVMCKFVFIFGVMEVCHMEEVIFWCMWFSFVGALHLLTQLCHDRLEFHSFSHSTLKQTPMNLFALLLFLLFVAVSVCITVGLNLNLSLALFMSVEWILIVFHVLYIFIKYMLHLYDLTYEGTWEKRRQYSYYTELFFELGNIVVAFLLHLHILYNRNSFLSLITFLLCLKLGCLFAEILKKMNEHNHYLKIVRFVERSYPLATRDDIDANSGGCVICLQKMDTARRLPCGHIFHISCLFSWLEQARNCPTCRTPLRQFSYQSQNGMNIFGERTLQLVPGAISDESIFNSVAFQYASWLPSFHVEINYSDILETWNRFVHLETMAYQVLQVFPDLPYNLVREDLVSTQSVETTVENILEERLVAPSEV